MCNGVNLRYYKIEIGGGGGGMVVYFGRKIIGFFLTVGGVGRGEKSYS